jgi:threonine/homoserine/homoserine lactone efflux protein
MLEAITIGFSTGVVLSLTFGTVFFAIVQSSIDNGYRSGVKIALGVLASDAVLIAIALFGTAFLPDIPNIKTIVGCVGGSLLVGLGGVNIFKKNAQLVYPQTRMGDFLYFFGKGFLLNILNPINFFSWVTVTAYVRSGLKLQGVEMYTFFLFSQLGILFAEALLSLFAHRLKRVINPQRLTWLNRITGAVFITVGIRILYTVLW